MNKYNCEIYKIKERKVKNKFRYDIVGYRMYPDVTKEMALYLAVKYGGCIAGFDENNAPCHPNNSDKVIGFHKWGNDICLASIHSVCRFENSIEGITIIPRVQSYGLPERDRWFNERIYRIIGLYRSDVLDDFSIEASHIWGPNSLIPERYEHIKKGVVCEGDYIFVHESYYGRPDNWLSVDASWAGCKIGTEIKYKGILQYQDDQGFRKDGDITYGYEPFVIRKITQL